MSQPPIARWATGTSQESLERSLKDVEILRRGRLKASDSETRYTPAGLSKSHYDTLRMDRDDLDYREWNEETGFSGLNRWPSDPGMGETEPEHLTESERKRRRKRIELDDGF
jgi:hypothetical protein